MFIFANVMDNESLKSDWIGVQAMTMQRFGEKMDTQSVLFVIGLQELGKLKKRFSKDQKVDIIHIAVCTVLEPYGYYEFKGYDDDGWPHWERRKTLPHLKTLEQEKFIKKAIVAYFDL